ncbi:hypothetical protein F2Q70_00015962 [Brassica cretica]|uniref:Uncharacterized protein n=1 Tax=Brassica cretica TaxID=69181 RepID=A0A8S9I245_BRACR|nr:hypothetical protein F2Q70_00015962 [Brassica cretica]
MSRPVPNRSGLIFERVTAGQVRAGCGPQNGYPIPYRKTCMPSRIGPQDRRLQTGYGASLWFSCLKAHQYGPVRELSRGLKRIRLQTCLVHPF